LRVSHDKIKKAATARNAPVAAQTKTTTWCERTHGRGILSVDGYDDIRIGGSIMAHPRWRANACRWAAYDDSCIQSYSKRVQ
jgi:hypothetical protein